MYPDEDSLRAGVEKTIKQRVPSVVWSALCWKGYVEHALTGIIDADELIDVIECLSEFRELFQAPVEVGVGSGRRGGQSVEWREVDSANEFRAIVQIMEIEASARSDVRRFRSDELMGKTLSFDQVDDWIWSHAFEATAPSMNEPEGVSLRSATSSAVLQDSGTRSDVRFVPKWPRRLNPPSRLLAYPHPVLYFSGGGTSHVRLPRQGPLVQLKNLAVELMQEYPWTEAQAVEFVLTGTCSSYAVAVVTEYLQFPLRIVLEIDPGLNAEQVSRIYLAAQRDILQKESGERCRTQSGRHLDLAVFLARGKSGTWRDMMVAWNTTRENQSHRYDDPRVFQRDVKAALGKLKSRRPDWGPGHGERSFYYK